MNLELPELLSDCILIFEPPRSIYDNLMEVIFYFDIRFQERTH